MEYRSKSIADEGSKSCARVNIKLIPSKVGCFLSSAYIGSFVAFLNVFFISVGMSEVRAGLLTAMIYTPCIVTGPLWGYLADYTKRRTLILTGLCIIAAVTMFALPWAAKGIYPMSEFQCNVTSAGNETNFVLLNATIDGQSYGECHRLNFEAKDTLFGVLFAIVFVSAMFVFPLMSYFEAIVANVSKIYGGSFGAQRLFGEIGISVSSYLTGVACDHFSIKDMSEYSPVFFIFPAICMVMLPSKSAMIQFKVAKIHQTMRKSARLLLQMNLLNFPVNRRSLNKSIIRATMLSRLQLSPI